MGQVHYLHQERRNGWFSHCSIEDPCGVIRERGEGVVHSSSQVDFKGNLIQSPWNKGIVIEPVRITIIVATPTTRETTHASHWRFRNRRTQALQWHMHMEVELGTSACLILNQKRPEEVHSLIFALS